MVSAVRTDSTFLQTELEQVVRVAWPLIAQGIQQGQREGTLLADLVVVIRLEDPSPKGRLDIWVVHRREVEALIGVDPSIEPNFAQPLPSGRLWLIARIGPHLRFNRLTVTTP